MPPLLDPPPGSTTARCTYKFEPPSPAPPLITPTEGPCRAPPPKLSRSLAAQLRKRWRRHAPTGKLEIRAGCDRLGPDLASSLVESQRDYSHPLTLTSLQRSPDGQHDLVRIEYRESSRTDNPPRQTGVDDMLVLHRARLPDATIAPLLARLRAAVHVEIQDRPPRPRPSSAGIGSTGSMAHHFAIRIVDDQGHGIQKTHQSWARPGLQSWTLPLVLSEETIDEFFTDPTIRAALMEIGPDDAAARDLFSRVFWDLEARTSTSHGWADAGFRRRVLGLAPRLGSAQHIPALLARLDPSAAMVFDEDRERVLAAIAALTGYDRRHDAHGHPRPIAEVAAETFAACTDAAPSAAG